MTEEQIGRYVPERGYWIGPRDLLPEQRPTLAVGQDPWRVVVRRVGGADEAVVRCRNCTAPRCGHSDDRDPCMERRHHRTTHLTLHGSFEPVGGYLRDEPSNPPGQSATP